MRKKTHKIPTEESLNNAALFYLGRFMASEASLKRVLNMKISRAVFANPAFAEDKATQAKLKAIVDQIVAKHVRLGSVNDSEYARIKCENMRTRGKSGRMIKQKLMVKGINASLINQNLSSEDDQEDQELKAARILFAKKRLSKDMDLETRRKMIATFSRAGFSYDVITKVLGTPEDSF